MNSQSLPTAHENKNANIKNFTSKFSKGGKRKVFAAWKISAVKIMENPFLLFIFRTNTEKEKPEGEKGEASRKNNWSPTSSGWVREIKKLDSARHHFKFKWKFFTIFLHCEKNPQRNSHNSKYLSGNRSLLFDFMYQLKNE